MASDDGVRAATAVRLRVASCLGLRPETDIACLIDAVGTLGRASDNDLVLADPLQYVSSRQARIERRDAGYYLIDIGRNPSVINERLLGQGQESVLCDGDQLVIGGYHIEVSLQHGVTVESAGRVGPLDALAPSQVVGEVDTLAMASILQGDPVFDSGPLLADPLGLGRPDPGTALPSLDALAPSGLADVLAPYPRRVL